MVMKMPSSLLLRRLRTPALTVLLLFVETLLGKRFQCPSKESLWIIYCLLYLLLPPFFLVIANLLLRPRRSAAAFPSQPPATHILFLIVQLGQAPLIWVSVVLLNVDFLSCSFRNVNYYTKPTVFSSLQICGLFLLALCVTLEYSLPRLPFLQKHLSLYHRRRQEELLLREIEAGVQAAADHNRKTFVQSMIGPDLDKLHPEDPGVQDVISRLVQQYQERAQKGFIAGGAEPKLREAQSETPPQPM